MKQAIRQAFDAVRDGWSPDRVVADPDLNSRYLLECARLGLSETPEQLNWRLLNLRKSGGLKGSAKSRETRFRDEGEYRFASEIAARFLERRDGVSLDRMICSPEKIQEFDRLAAELAPGYSPLQYHWAALALRKTRKLSPEIIAHALPAVSVTRLRVVELDLKTIPPAQGLYIFFDPTQVLYIGEAENLRLRIEKHLEHSDNKHLARWLWDQGNRELFLELHLLDPVTKSKVRRSLETELIRSRRPLFNIQGVEPQSQE